jgi:hypothetical protein
LDITKKAIVYYGSEFNRKLPPTARKMIPKTMKTTAKIKEVMPYYIEIKGEKFKIKK